jgi:putative ABC transport system permease protein
VIGIVNDIKYTGLDRPAGAAIYLPWSLMPAGVSHMVVKTAGDTAGVAQTVQRVIRDMDSSMPIPDVERLDARIVDSIADRRLRVVPALGFAILAGAVSLVGLFAALARAVAERRRELAVRGALGASPGVTVRLVLAHGVKVTIAGIAVGLAVSWASSRYLASMLYGVGPHDPATFVGVAVGVGAAALVASYLGARRALDIEVGELLRAE